MSRVDVSDVSKRYGAFDGARQRHASPSTMASSSACSDPRAPARPRCCAPSPASSMPDEGTHQLRRRAGRVRAGASARHRHGVPVLCAVPASDRRREYRLRPRCPRRRPGEDIEQARRRRCWRWCACPASAAASRSSSPAASSSASPWRARLITRPKVLLLDEPLGALDRRLRQEMQVELREIQRETGITAIFVTHDQEEALTLSDRIAIINDGRLIQIGKPQEVYERPPTSSPRSSSATANVFRGSAGRRRPAPRRRHGDRHRRPLRAVPPSCGRKRSRSRAGTETPRGNSPSGRSPAGDLFRRQRHLPDPHRRTGRRAAAGLRPEPVRRGAGAGIAGHGEPGTPAIRFRSIHDRRREHRRPAVRSDQRRRRPCRPSTCSGCSPKTPNGPRRSSMQIVPQVAPHLPRIAPERTVFTRFLTPKRADRCCRGNGSVYYRRWKQVLAEQRQQRDCSILLPHPATFRAAGARRRQDIAFRVRGTGFRSRRSTNWRPTR